MSFGLSATNNGGSVVISSDYKTLVFSERGTFQITSRFSNGEGSGAATFTKVVQTQEPPQVFVRFVSGSHTSLSFYTTITGSPGNWTGFKVVSAILTGNQTQNFSMEYVSCKYSDKKSVDMYGLEIYDYQGNIVYTSSDRVVRYSKFTKNWTWMRPNYPGVVNVFNSGLVLDADDFVSISSIDRGVSWNMGLVTYAGLRIRNGGVPVVQILTNATNPGDNWKPDVATSRFSIPVCKFPIARYYNT